MFAQLEAKYAAVHVVASGFYRGRFGTLAWVALAALSLGGCLQTTSPLVGADPADPGARVTGAGYRSTTAPYTRMRPTAPTSWGGQRSDGLPPKSDK
jgi:hypothetical protein